MRVAQLFVALLAFVCVAHAEDKKPTDTAPLKAQIKEIGAESLTDALLGVGLLTVNDLRLLTAEDMKELKFDADAKGKVNEWIDSKTGKTEIEIPVFSSEIEAKLQEEGIKSAADIRTLSEDDMMDMGMNIGQRNRVFNWIEHTAAQEKEGGAKKEGGKDGAEEDDEFYDDEEEEESKEAEEMAPEDPNKPRVRGFGMKMKRSAVEGDGKKAKAKKNKNKKAKLSAEEKKQKEEEWAKARIPDNAPKYKVDKKGKFVIGLFFACFFGFLFYSFQQTQKAKQAELERHDEPDSATKHIRSGKSDGKVRSIKASSNKGKRGKGKGF